MQSSPMQPSLKERQRREREALILQAAEDVFIEKGYYDTSMEEIAVRVGIAKGTIYLHFASKEALVVAILTRDMEIFLEELEVALATEQTARAKLAAFLKSMHTGLRRKRNQFLSSISYQGDVRCHLSEHGHRIHELWEQMAHKVAGILEEGKAAGEFKATLPTRMMLCALFSLSSPHVFERLGLEKDVPPEEFVEYVATIFFNGVQERQ